MLSNDFIRQISGGQSGTYIFDFSRISKEHYEPLFRTLQHFAQRNIDYLGFNCDELAKNKAKSLSRATVSSVVLNSIAKNKSHYIANLVELICYIIPRSQRIKGIELATIPFKQDQIERICNAIGKSKTLISISFCQIPLGDQGLISFLNAINPNKIKSISIKYCGISDASAQSIINFISKKTSPDGISKINFSNTELSQESRVKIEKALNSFPMITEKEGLYPFNEELSNFQTKSQQSIQTSKFSPKSNVKASPKGTPTSNQHQMLHKQKDIDEDELNALKEENQALQAELSSLKNSMNVIQYSSDVFLVGKGAQDFIQFLTQIESKIQEFEKKINND